MVRGSGFPVKKKDEKVQSFQWIRSGGTKLNLLIILAMTALAAYFTKRFMGRIGIPTVTGYVLVGVLLGISLLHILGEESLEKLSLANDLALGLIGFTIGSELRRDVFKKLGRSIILIALCESLVAFLFVTTALLILAPSKVYQALILGAVASATAPAATVHVIQQYKAKGPLTSTILAVVGIDDAIALMIFVFASVIAKGFLIHAHITVMAILVKPIIEITTSLLMGSVSGILFVWLFRRVRFPDDLSLGSIAFILFNLGLAERFHLSGLLAVMAFGSVSVNLNPMLANRSGKTLENFAPILFAYFFIFGGAHLDFSLLPKVGLVGLLYLLARASGKISGASLGAWLGKAPATVRKYIGFSLIPQVGVAIALAIMVKKQFGNGAFGERGDQLATLVINVLLFTTIITEIVGPLLTKMAITRAGERQV